MKTAFCADGILRFAINLVFILNLLTFLDAIMLFCFPLDGHSGFLKMTRAKPGKQIFVLSQSSILLKIFGRK